MLSDLPTEERAERLALLSEDEVATLLADWLFWSRPEQRAPSWAWRWWLILTGRGWGKNRTGAEWMADRCEAFALANAPHLFGLVNRTFGHVRALQVDGESGLAAVCERRGMRLHHPSTSQEGRIEVQVDGHGEWHASRFEIHTADDPDRLRGRNLHSVHLDEAATYRMKEDAQGGTVFTNTDFALRALCPPGLTPQGIITTTPRPVPLVKGLIAGEYGEVAVTKGSMYDNARNLAPAFVGAVLRTYHGTRLGAQEILGIVLDDVEGALWQARLIEMHRWSGPPPPFVEVVVGVDPPGETAECGIVVVGMAMVQILDPATGLLVPRRGLWALEDYSHAGPPESWGATVVRAIRTYGCTRAVVEKNMGGDMVRSTIHAVDPTVQVSKVTAAKGKYARAEPVAVATAQGRVKFVGVFPDLEAQMTTWVPPEHPASMGDGSPDRMDGFVWAAKWLLGEEGGQGRAVSPSAGMGGTPAAPGGRARGAAARTSMPGRGRGSVARG